MILRLLGVITLFIALSSSIVLGATMITDFQPELYSGFSESKISVSSEGDIIVVYSYTMPSWKASLVQSGAYRYHIHFEAPVAKSPSSSTITVEYRIKECSIYVVSDPQVASNILNTVPSLIPYSGGYINPTEYSVARSIIESVADYKDVRPPYRTSSMDRCSIDSTAGSTPQFILAEIVLDRDSVEVYTGDMYINGGMMAKIIENITTNPELAARVATVTAYVTYPQGPQPPTPVVSTVAVGPRDPVFEYLMHEFAMTFEASIMRITAMVTLDVIDLWRIASIMLAGIMIIVLDASRNPSEYSSGPWRLFRRIAEILGIARR